jgi:hypothetical protein
MKNWDYRYVCDELLGNINTLKILEESYETETEIKELILRKLSKKMFCQDLLNDLNSAYESQRIVIEYISAFDVLNTSFCELYARMQGWQNSMWKSEETEEQRMETRDKFFETKNDEPIKQEFIAHVRRSVESIKSLVNRASSAGVLQITVGMEAAENFIDDLEEYANTFDEISDEEKQHFDVSVRALNHGRSIFNPTPPAEAASKTDTLDISQSDVSSNRTTPTFGGGFL